MSSYPCEGRPAPANVTRECVELSLTFYRSSDGSSRTARLLLPPDARTVPDLKLRVQREFGIPVCQQKVALRNHTLEDSQTVAQLYIRHQDALTVTYYVEADVKFLGAVLDGSIKPLVGRLEASPQLLSQPWEGVGEGLQKLVTLTEDQLHSVTYTSLMPWGSPRAESNRQFIVQEGGVGAMLQLYALLQTVPWEQRTDHMQSLEVSCVSFLWNFGETAYARRLVVEGGGFAMMLKSLAVHGDEEFLRKYRIHWIFDSTVGAVSNYSELEACQLPLVQNTRAMNRLLHFAIHGLSLNFFTKMLIANCAFRLSHNLEVHAHLAQGDILGKILAFYQQSQQAYGPNQLIRYCICLALARIVLYSYKTIPVDLRPRVLQALRDPGFPVPATLTAMLEKFQYNWVTVVPLVEAVFVPICSGEGGEGDSLWRDCCCASVDVVITGLQAEMGRQRNRALVHQQGLLEYIVCFPWGMASGDWEDRLKTVVRVFQLELKSLPVPRLSTIAKATLARTNRDFSMAFRKQL